MKVLYLCHCLPYPPDKGDRRRAYYELEHLAKKHEIHLRCLSREPVEQANLKKLEEICATVEAYKVGKLSSFFRAVMHLLSNKPLTLAFFENPQMRKALADLNRENNFDAVISYCSSTAQYGMLVQAPNRIVDLVDVDSRKWSEYTAEAVFPFSIIYSREGRLLHDWEKTIAEHFNHSVVTTEYEYEILQKMLPNRENSVAQINNGVDFTRFHPEENAEKKNELLFVGQLDYRPNVDAVFYFYKEILPLVRKRFPNIVFKIVGRNPVKKIAEVCRTAELIQNVESVAPYYREAKVFVAPIRMAYGIQNKVLESMACGTPVVATPSIKRSLHDDAEDCLLVGDSPQTFAEEVIRLLEDQELYAAVTRNALEYVQRHHSWETNLSEFERLLD